MNSFGVKAVLKYNSHSALKV